MAEHRFFRFTRDPKDSERVELISTAVLNGYTKENLSRNNWMRKGEFIIPWTRDTRDATGAVNGKEQRQSAPLTLKLLDDHIQVKRTFDHDALGLFDPRCVWLDFSLDVALNSTVVPIKTISPLGDSYPYHPFLDREGRSNTDFQGVLLKRIKALRHELVEDSVNPGGDVWLEKFRNLVSECVSLIDGTLHQIYYKAKFAPEPGWVFDEKSLGPRHAKGLKKKLGWVFKITGKHVNANDDWAAFVHLKDLRNHLQHFDPPSFCYTYEDAAAWLNLVPAVGRLNWAIRKCIGATLSVPLIQLLLESPVEFVPMANVDPRPRKPQADTVGYASVRVKAESSGSVCDDRIARRQAADQDKTVELLTDEGLANLLEKDLEAHRLTFDLTTAAAIRSAAKRLRGQGNG
jgi:hypothetical protein